MSAVDTNGIDLAEPHLLRWLGTFGLDVEYVRAAGNLLFRRDDTGAEVPVLDLAGGYGSLMFGHNHPRLVARARALLDAQAPIHAQFSRHPYAQEVAGRLSAIVQRELGVDEPYTVVFANSGAEAVEAAVKHAELDRTLRLAALVEAIGAHVQAARAAVDDGRAVLTDAAQVRAGAPALGDGRAGFEAVAASVTRANAAALAAPPSLLALEAGFHGKLVGSVQLTHNPAYRTPFGALAAPARFLPVGDLAALDRVVEERPVLLDMVVDDGAVDVVERPLPGHVAFLVEPIQGEGGMNVLGRDYLEAVRETAEALGCPLVVDEAQSGMGRSGAFLASAHAGLRADHYVLAKSLGGGLAKVTAMLTRRSRYREEFEYVHSSTFAKDVFGCRIALEVLDMLEEDSGRAYRQAAERGEALRSRLEAVRRDFPDVVKDVRGRGLMLGMELQAHAYAESEVIREKAQTELLGYAVAGYLLRHHDVRIFPTASAVTTLRFEPSVYLTGDEIDWLESALRAACGSLRG